MKGKIDIGRLNSIMPVKFTAGVLFAGFGAADLGLTWAGYDVRWQVEIDPWRRAVLRKNFPETERYGDIKQVQPEQLEPVDLIFASPHCQAISVAGKRQGERDSRWLWPDTVRIVLGLRPHWLLFENPREFLSFPESRGVLADLERAGYEIWILDIGAEDAGAPHRRRRIWIVGKLARAASCFEQRERSGNAACDSGQAATGNTPLFAEREPPNETDAFSTRRQVQNESSNSGSKLGYAESVEARRKREESRRQQVKTRRSSTLLADSSGNRCGESGTESARQQGRSDAEECSGELADADEPRLSFDSGERSYTSEERSPFIRDRWPAAQGPFQYDWEQARVADASLRAAWRARLARQAEHHGRLKRLLGVPVDGVARWLDRLASYHNREIIRAAGDSLVPQIVEALAKAIRDCNEN